MKPEDRALVVAVLAIVLVVAPIGAVLLLTPPALPTSLPVPAGTAFTVSDSVNWTVHFRVPSAGGTLVGAWTAYDGLGAVGLIVVNGTVSRPFPPQILCQLLPRWAVQNGSVDRALAPGAYTVYWNTGYCAYASQIVVTQAIQILPP